MSNNTLNLTPTLQKALLEFFKVAQNYPLSDHAKQLRQKIDNGEFIECPVSGDLYDAAEVETLQDSVGPVLNTLHPSLRKDVKGMVPVVCIQCREVVAWVAPGRDEIGFETKPGEIVHIYCCPKCEPEKFLNQEVGTTFIERQIFAKHNKS